MGHITIEAEQSFGPLIHSVIYLTFNIQVTFTKSVVMNIGGVLPYMRPLIHLDLP